jgi:hypothetical protein
VAPDATCMVVGTSFRISSHIISLSSNEPSGNWLRFAQSIFRTNETPNRLASRRSQLRGR